MEIILMLDAQLFPWQGLQVDPRFIASNHLMQLSTLELEQAIRQELDENPALEMVERTSCRSCGALLRFGSCSSCSGSASSPPELFQSASDDGPGDTGRILPQEDNDCDPLGG